MAENIKNDFSVFFNKKVIVTGDTGFKGSWLTTWLLLIGADVYGYALPPQNKFDNFVKCGLKTKYNHTNGDVRDKEKLIKFIKDVCPEIIFHLAAQPIVLESYQNPHYTFETNIMGTINLLEAVRETKSVKSVVIITSDKVYENKNKNISFKEDDLLGGNDPYSASKAGCEIVVSSYINSFFNNLTSCNVATARAGNVIGGGDWGEHRIIPDFYRAINKKKPIEIRNPNYVRPWQFVLEPLSGYLLLASKLLESNKYVGAWNFGPAVKSNITVKELIEKIINFYNKGGYKITGKTKEFSESSLLNLDISKAMELLNWKPKLNIDETVKFTIEGYDDELAENLFEKRTKQIKQFLELKI